jgi:hypothetical protein
VKAFERIDDTLDLSVLKTRFFEACSMLVEPLPIALVRKLIKARIAETKE